MHEQLNHKLNDAASCDNQEHNGVTHMVRRSTMSMSLSSGNSCAA